MNTTFLLVSAAAVLGFIGCAHSYLGERFVFGRLFALHGLPRLHNDRQYTERVLRWPVRRRVDREPPNCFSQVPFNFL